MAIHARSSIRNLVQEQGSYSYLDAGGEQTVCEITGDRAKMVRSIWLDLNTITQNGTVKVYYKIDGTNYRLAISSSFTVATDPDGFNIQLDAALDHDFKVTYTEAVDEGADRAIPYAVFWEAR